MKTPRLLAAALLVLSGLAVWAGQPPSISSVDWKDPNARTNYLKPVLVIQGSNLGAVNNLKLEGGGRVIPLGMVKSFPDRIEAFIPEPTLDSVFPYTGFYTVKVGSPDGTAASPSTLTVYGLNIPASDRSSSSVQSNIVLEFKANYAVQVRQAKLRGSDKTLWPSKQVQANRITWDAVPAAEYEVFLFDANGKLMWKSPDKFRVFANANR